MLEMLNGLQLYSLYRGFLFLIGFFIIYRNISLFWTIISFSFCYHGVIVSSIRVWYLLFSSYSLAW